MAVLEILEPRVDGVGQPLEQGKIGERREEAAGEDDLEAADTVGQAAEEDEEGCPGQERNTEEGVGRQIADLEGDGEEEEGVELPRVPDPPLTGGGAEQGEQHVLVVRGVEEAL